MLRILTSGSTPSALIEISRPPFGASGALSLGLIIATGAAAILAFHAISFIAQIIATPMIFGIGIGVAVHIALYGPKESVECAKEILAKIPHAIETAIIKTPVILHQMAAMTRRHMHMTLQTIGRRVNPPSKTPYTIREVAKGLVVEGRALSQAWAQKAHRKSSPIIREYIRSGWEFVKES
jgi:hypothetical protein